MKGRLIYLMGPSGSGKDSLLESARTRLEQLDCRIARRVVTRPAQGEAADTIDMEGFQQRMQQGDFALSWFANGLAYGVPIEIDDWLESGHDVLVNGSRAYLPIARERYHNLLPVLLQVDERVLRTRLLARGRENLEAIEQRLLRNRQLQAQQQDLRDAWLLDNSGTLDDAVTRLLQLISQQRQCA